MIAVARSSSSRRTAARSAVHLGRVERRVQDLALLAVGAAHEHGVHPLGVVAGDGPRPLGGLVVGVGVDGQEAACVGHAAHAIRDAGAYTAARA